MESTSANIRVLLVDDHPTIRQTLRSTLEAYPNIEVVGEASDGEEAIVRVDHLQPAVVIMDIYMYEVSKPRRLKINMPVLIHSFRLSPASSAH